jgi:hypothetical protein
MADAVAEVVAVAHDGSWHFSAVPPAPANVGYRGHTGRHMLIARFSHFDPKADSVVSWSQCKSVRDHVGAAVRLISEEFRSTKDLPDLLRQTRYSDH